MTFGIHSRKAMPVFCGLTEISFVVTSFMKRAFPLLVFCSIAFAGSCSPGMDRVRRELGIDELHSRGINGQGVLVAIMDRGIDWRNDDFRHPDGTTRIDTIWDSTAGTVSLFSRDQINRALKEGSDLPARDAVGHGTTTAGIAAGSGRNAGGKYCGVAPNATLIIAKITGGAPAHDDQPAEPLFYDERKVLDAIDFIARRARELKMPCVMLLNVGSIGGPTDASSALARKIDATVGPGTKGLVFVTGPGDDGGRQNHARGILRKGTPASLRYWKDSPGPTVVDLWYPGQSRVSVAVESIEGKVLCQPSARPATNDDWFEQKGEQARYMHLGSKRLYFGSQSDRREVWFTFDGPPGEYHLVLDRQDDADIGDLFFDAFSPGNAPTPLLPPHNRFLNHIATGGSIWHGAAAKHNICPGDYVIRTDYVAADGRSVSLDKAGVVGELWKGSSVGPTIDGRAGVHFCAPGDHVFTTYGMGSDWAQLKYASNFIATGAGWIYGRASAVSAAAPVAAGVIALMLQVSPELDAIQVREVLCRTAKRDRFTGEVPNSNWGSGKLRALAAIQKLTESATER